MIFGFLPIKNLPCFAWIGAVLLVGGLAWLLTQSYRTRILMEEVNKTLVRNGNMSIEALTGNPASHMGGFWFGVRGSADRAHVFTMMQDGIAAACVALVDSNGKVRTIIPLSSNARQINENQPVYRFYAGRIEQEAQNKGFNQGGR
jgi:hypothetical protein